MYPIEDIIAVNIKYKTEKYGHYIETETFKSKRSKLENCQKCKAIRVERQEL